MNFEEYLAENRDARQFHDHHMNQWLKHDKAAEVRRSKAKRYPDEAAEHLAAAKDHEDQAAGHKREMESWAKKVKTD